MSTIDIKRELKELKKIISEQNRFTKGLIEDIRVLKGWGQIKKVLWPEM